MASLNTTTMTRSRYRTAVSISVSAMPSPPSPVKAITGSPGVHSAAAMAAGSAKPIVASPLEASSRYGSLTGHSGMATSMWAPASTVAIVSGGVWARTVVTTSCGVTPARRGGGRPAQPAGRADFAAAPAASGQLCLARDAPSAPIAAGSGATSSAPR